ncbi:MAG: hypothetical protein GTN68_24425 [Candidatus Aminicenantes bacterium]|nr:hypothetical protein [Candidatus Aminicenantes bacterium]NIO83704.1 hypothetical protein [Candidatus Aminicenantes bacterium]
MLKNKKLLTAILLMIVYALLLCQEVVLIQVLCYKDNGCVDLELAAFSIQCHCQSHKHHSHPSLIAQSEKCSQFSSKFDFDCCYDQLLNSPWLERNITDNIFAVNLIKQHDLTYQNNTQLTEPFRQLPEAVPVSKFLYPSPFPNGSVILRC